MRMPGAPVTHGARVAMRAAEPMMRCQNSCDFEIFLRAAINQLRGLGSTDRRRLVAEVRKPLDSPQSKRQFARGRFLDDGRVEPVGGGQGSHVMGGLAQADCLIVIPEGVAHVNSGDTVDVVDLRGDVG